VHKHERPQLEARGAVDDPRQDRLTAPSTDLKVQPEAPELPEGVAPPPHHESAATSPVMRDSLERQAPLDEAAGALLSRETVGLRGDFPWLVDLLVAAGRLARHPKLKLEVIAGAAYTLIAMAHMAEAGRSARAVVTVMYLVLAMTHLIAPYLPNHD
jgi:hypothetical protein